MHVVFLDYDIKHSEENEKWLDHMIRKLQNKFNLGDFDVFQTAGGYHAVCYSLVTYGELIDILTYAEVDYGFKIQAVLRPEQALTLRFYSLNEKKYSKYLFTVVRNPTPLDEYERPISEEHRQFFMHLKNEKDLIQETGKPLPIVYYHHNKTIHKDNPKTLHGDANDNA
jgi:hypothetical protein